MYDVIIVGARCAGAPTAMLLARQGYDVLLVDRATFPSDIPHGHFIHKHGPRRLHQWGLLESIVRTNSPPITTVTLDLGDFPLTGMGLSMDGVAMGYGPRRSVLDAVLVDAAVEAGAELREGFVVEDFTTDGDRITGVIGRHRETGSTVTEHATVVVGADGRNSRLARAVRAPSYEAVPPVACWYFSYWSGVPATGLEVYLRDRRIVFAFPANDGLFAVFVAWAASELSGVRENIEAQFMAALDRVPDLAERVRSGRREERFYGAIDLPNFLRKPYGPGWALVGDAGCHKDPYLALGVCDAFRDAELLAEALDAGLSERQPLDAALASFARQRDEMTLPDYRENLALAQFTPIPADVLRLRAAIRGDQAETNRFFLAREGMIPPPTFFNRANLERIMGATQSA